MLNRIISYEQELAEKMMAVGPVILFFCLSDCPPCRVAMKYAENCNDYDDGLVIFKVLVEEHPEFAASWRVTTAPTLVFIRGNRELRRATKFNDQAHYDRWASDDVDDSADDYVGLSGARIEGVHE